MGPHGEEVDRVAGEPKVDAAVIAALLAHVDETVVVLDGVGTVTAASPGLRTLLGYEPETVVGRSLLEFLHPKEIDELVESIDRWTDRSGTPRGQVQTVRAADGSWVKIHYDAVVGEAAAPLGAMVLTMRRPESADAERNLLLQRLLNEDRLVRLASAFLHVPVDRFDEGLERALAELAGLEWVTRVSVWSSAGTRAVRRGQWQAARNAPALALPEALRHEGSHILRRLVAGEEVHITSVRHLPDDWSKERGALERAGVRSLLAVPMVHVGTFAGFVMIVGLAFALVPSDIERRIRKISSDHRRARFLERLATVPATLAEGIRVALKLVAHPTRAGLAVLGAVGFWAANIGILWASFKAFHIAIPLGVVVMGFFIGMAANLIPFAPAGVGAVDAGLIGTFVLFGFPEEQVFAAILIYRLVAFWLPIPPGVVAFFQLRKTVKRWKGDGLPVDRPPQESLVTEVT